MADNRGKIKRYFLIAAAATMQLPTLLKQLYLSTPTFEQRSQSSNGHAIRLDIISKDFCGLAKQVGHSSLENLPDQ
jgi:hypothetical protein